MKQEQLKFEFDIIDTFLQNRINEDTAKADYKHRFKQSHGLWTTKPSKTVQGEEISLSDLMIKTANGIRPAIMLSGDYDENPTHDDVSMEHAKNLDLVEKNELKEMNINKLKTLSERQRQEREQREVLLKSQQNLTQNDNV